MSTGKVEKALHKNVWEALAGMEKMIDSMQTPHPRAFAHDTSRASVIGAAEDTARQSGLESCREPPHAADTRFCVDATVSGNESKSYRNEWLRARPFPDCLAAKSSGMGWRCKVCGYDSEKKNEDITKLPAFHSSLPLGHDLDFRFIPVGVCCNCAYPDRPASLKCPICRTRSHKSSVPALPVPMETKAIVVGEDDFQGPDALEGVATSTCPGCSAEQFDPRCSVCRRRKFEGEQYACTEALGTAMQDAKVPDSVRLWNAWLRDPASHSSHVQS